MKLTKKEIETLDRLNSLYEGGRGLTLSTKRLRWTIRNNPDRRIENPWSKIVIDNLRKKGLITANYDYNVNHFYHVHVL
tara:strand:+ start:167 stop:403 length:237 start_codon:yes stop_codon:yes gene_type:complete